MYLMWLEGTHILYIIDSHTGLRNTAIVRWKSPAQLQISFLENWAFVDTGYQVVKKMDYEAGFSAQSFRKLATAHRVRLIFSGTQLQNSISSGRTYYEQLQRVFAYSDNNTKPSIQSYCYDMQVKGSMTGRSSMNYFQRYLFFGTPPKFVMDNRQPSHR